MTVDLGEPAARPVDAGTRRRTRRRARAAVARSAAVDRVLVALIGLVLLAAGVGVALLSYGVFGVARSGRPLLDPIAVAAVQADLDLWRGGALAVGLLLAVFGLAWVARSVRPEPRPDMRLEGGRDTTILVSSAAFGEAVAGQAGALPGVARARARLVGSPAAPALRITLWLADDADVRGILLRVHDEVVATARAAFALPTLPVAVRLELERPQAGPRVA